LAQQLSTSPAPEHGRTAQQWAWQFLRRNPEYIAAYELISTLTQEQSDQLNFLIDQRKGQRVSEDLLDEAVICTLDLRFFEAKFLEHVGDPGETVEAYLDRTSKIIDLDEDIELKVSMRFWLESYCLTRWIDPAENLEVDAEAAARLWAHFPSIEWGLASAPWLDSMSGVDADGFRPIGRRGRSFNADSAQVEVKFPMVKGADGSMFIRSATVWGNDYQLPQLEVSEVDVRFDLNLPLAFQIKQAKAELEKHQKLLRGAKIVDRYPSQADKNGMYRDSGSAESGSYTDEPRFGV
jgi:hypothetical protein